jgi:hypothetical protein
MSWFGKIKSAIFGSADKPAATVTPVSGTTATASMAGATAAKPTAPPPGSPPTSAAPAPASPAATATAAATPANPAIAEIDVVAILTDKARGKQQLNWKTSIVDLMKLLDLDSSLTARKELATELGYTGDTSDSAAMNIWLHKQVMRKLAESGGKVPDELRA